VQAQSVARLATVGPDGRPHAVPVCYAFDGARFYTPLDEKPKRVAPERLQRVRNITARPEAALLIDRYDDDWSRLGYVLARGVAELLLPGTAGQESARARALTLLRERYPQYRAMNLEAQPVIALAPSTVSSWGPAPEGDPDGAAASGRGVDFPALARGRRSVRVFDSRPVPRGALERMLDVACWAPSPHGRQPWRFAVLTRSEPKERLAAAMGDEWERTLRLDREPEETVQARLARSRERILRAPAIVVVCLYTADLDHYPDAARQAAEETMAIQSLGAAVQNLLLEAFALGLDAGWMCAPLFCQETVRAALGLDAALLPHALLTIGYAAQDPRRRPRRPLDELIVMFE
jgi:coenzyme F420-0:L-glutamate ligase/coenzyme F420-1:gamma-L-glutamate ligase